MLCLAEGVGGTEVFSRSMSASTGPVKLVNPGMIRAIRAARSWSRSRVWLVPANTSMSPDLASRTCTMIGPACVPAVWCGWSAAGGRLVPASAGPAAAPMAVAASPAAPAVAAPCSRERRDSRRSSVPSGACFAS